MSAVALTRGQAMTRVYAHMFLAVITSFVVSWLVAASPQLMAALFTGWVAYVVILLPLAMIFLVTPLVMNTNSWAVATLTLQVFAAVMGLSLSAIMALYTTASIVSAFLGAAALFGTLSVYGLVTKRDLTELGQFLFAGVIALIIASLINLFVGSTVAQMAISAVGIIVFLGLTAYDSQRISSMVSSDPSPANTVLGALSLYLDFINLFIFLIQLFGQKK
jgi:uncharacterized protein